MGFHFHYTFIRTLVGVRTLWLAGHYGTGKTALAFAIARHLVLEGYADYIVSNIPSLWADPIERVETFATNSIKLRTVFILDEGGRFLNGEKDGAVFADFFRKMDCYALIASRTAPPKNLKDFSAHRAYNLYALGLPCWMWKTTYRDGNDTGKTNKENSYFYYWNPRELFGVYDTESMPLDDAGLSWLLKAQERKYGKSNAKFRRLGKREYSNEQS